MTTDPTDPRSRGKQCILVCLAWTLVLIPLVWGVWMTVRGALALFNS